MPRQRTLQAAIDSAQRAEKNRARDVYRHPGEMLAFFGVKPDSVVVEIDPGGAGYWTEILAPYLKYRGRYVAALPEPTSEEAKNGAKAFAAKLAADLGTYGKVETSEFGADRHAIAPARGVRPLRGPRTAARPPSAVTTEGAKGQTGRRDEVAVRRR